MDSTILFAEDVPDSTIYDRVARDELARLVSGIYTIDISADLTDIEWFV